MPLVPAKCTCCGASLNVEESKDAAICPYCNTPFIVEKAINNYNITNSINANVVNVFNAPVQDFVVRGGILERYNGNDATVIIPDDVIQIGFSAFENCISITALQFPEGVHEIDDQAFKDCRNIRSVVFPHTLERIGAYAFSNCTNLTEINIPDTVTEIGEHAFSDCLRLSKVTLPNSVVSLGESVFKNCKSLIDIALPENLRALYEDTFFGCSKLERVIIPDNFSILEDGVFCGCSSLKELSNNKQADTDVQLLTDEDSLIISDSVKKICTNAFKNAFVNKAKIKKIIVMNPECEIERGAFNGCCISLYLRERLYKQTKDFLVECTRQYNSNHSYDSSLLLNIVEIANLFFTGSIGEYDDNTSAGFETNCYDSDTVLQVQKNTFFDLYSVEDEIRNIQGLIWKEQGLCPKCGGTLVKKLFSFKCTECGHKV